MIHYSLGGKSCYITTKELIFAHTEVECLDKIQTMRDTLYNEILKVIGEYKAKALRVNCDDICMHQSIDCAWATVFVEIDCKYLIDDAPIGYIPVDLAKHITKILLDWEKTNKDAQKKSFESFTGTAVTILKNILYKKENNEKEENEL